MTIHNEMECVWNVKADIFCLRHWSNLECVGEEVMLPTEWRDIRRVTEMECVQNVEADIFHLRHWPIEVSPDTLRKFQQTSNGHLSKTNHANSVKPIHHMLNNSVLNINVLTVTSMPQNISHNNVNNNLESLDDFRRLKKNQFPLKLSTGIMMDTTKLKAMKMGTLTGKIKCLTLAVLNLFFYFLTQFDSPSIYLNPSSFLFVQQTYFSFLPPTTQHAFPL